MSVTRSEDLTSQIDGIVQEFTVSGGPFIDSTLKVYHNGLLLRSGEGLDFVEATGLEGFTTGVVPVVGDTIQVEYEVFPAGVITDGYASVQDIRDEGITESQKSDAAVEKLIARSSLMIDKLTGRFFEPRSLTLLLDGTGKPGLLLGDPIISIESIRLISEDYLVATDLEVDLSDLRIYNRHLQGLLNPDDRESPLIEWITYDARYERYPFTHTLDQTFYATRWPEGTQNVEVVGLFGYTDPDGTDTGQTPELIRRAAVLMVLKDIDVVGSSDRYDARNAWRMTEIKTRDQSIKWADPTKAGARGVGYLTGDPEVDNILIQFVRPPELGAA